MKNTTLIIVLLLSCIGYGQEILLVDSPMLKAEIPAANEVEGSLPHGLESLVYMEDGRFYSRNVNGLVFFNLDFTIHSYFSPKIEYFQAAKIVIASNDINFIYDNSISGWIYAYSKNDGLLFTVPAYTDGIVNELILKENYIYYQKNTFIGFNEQGYPIIDESIKGVWDLYGNEVILSHSEMSRLFQSYSVIEDKIEKPADEVIFDLTFLSDEYFVDSSLVYYDGINRVVYQTKKKDGLYYNFSIFDYFGTLDISVDIPSELIMNYRDTIERPHKFNTTEMVPSSGLVFTKYDYDRDMYQFYTIFWDDYK
jgi:hypothetical protein